MRRTRSCAFLCVAALALHACHTPSGAPVGPPPPPAAAPDPVVAVGSAGRETIDIDDGSDDEGKLVVAVPDPRAAAPSVAVEPLGPGATDALVARMEPLPVLANDDPPVTRAASLPPPPPRGEAQPLAFALTTGGAVPDAPARPAAPPVRALTAPQITPEGDVRTESEIRVRFDEPMIAVAAVGTPAVPAVVIAPAVPGTWRWLDTRVLVFTASGARLPQATAFTVTVAAGVRALSGNALATPVEQHFTTPPVHLAGVYPATPLRPDSAVAIQLDQDVDTAQIATMLAIDDAHAPNARLRFHVVDLAEAERRWRLNPDLHYDTAVRHGMFATRAVLVAPDTAWPHGVSARVTLAAGAPSREGPRVAAKPSFARFDVAPEMRVAGITCGDREKPVVAGGACPARGYLTVSMTNPIEEASFRAANVQIAGQPFQDVKPSGTNVGMEAPSTVGRTFRIEVTGDLLDTYGQPLVGGRALAFTTSAEQFDPALIANSGLDVLDPRFKIPQWTVATQAVRAVRVELYQVQPEDYFAYEDYELKLRATPPGKRVYDKVIEVGARFGVEARVDLRPALGAGGVGHVVAVATAIPASSEHLQWLTPRVSTWTQVTKLGLAARVDGDKAQAWVRDLTPASFLAPIAGARATILTDDRAASATVVTDADGHATEELLPGTAPKPPSDRPSHATTALLAVRTATDVTFAAIEGDGHRVVRERDALWYATDDRFTYKPGETVYVKGWVRWTTAGINPDLAAPAAGDTIAYTLTDAESHKIASGTAPLTEQGGFDVAVAIPDNAHLGTADFRFTTHGHTHDLPIAVQEFRTPAYAVSLTDDVTHAGATPLVLGERIEMRAEAKYYAGGGLPGANIQWVAKLQPTAYAPPGWDLFTFTPPSAHGAYRARSSGRTIEVKSDATLTGASLASATFGIAALAGHQPAVLSVDATVADVDRMHIRASSRPILVHPSDYYVGLHLLPEDRDQIEVVVTDIDGNTVPGVPVAVELRGVLGSERARDDAALVDAQHCQLTSGATPVLCRWHRASDKLAYTATARIADHRGRANGAQYAVPWVTFRPDEPLRLTADRAIYKPGDVAKLQLVSDVVPATAIVSFARRGVFAQKRIELTAATTTIELPIEPAFISNVHVVVDRLAPRRVLEKGSTLPLPETASIDLELPVSIESARLVMTARPTSKIVEPGAEATFEVAVARGGKPVEGAEVALMVVDEAVLALSTRRHGDPLGEFYRAFGSEAEWLSNLDQIRDQGPIVDAQPATDRFDLTERGDVGGAGRFGYGLGGGGMGSYGMAGFGSNIVESRKDFRANAVFSPRLHTDASGRVRLTVKMPDSLTRFRIVALAASDLRYFGKAEGTVIVQRKINARTVAPRFLTQGDAFSLPIVVQNLDRAPRTIELAVRAANLVGVGPAGKRVTVGAGQRAEVRFDFRAQGRGHAAVETIAVSGDFADASTVQFPVYAPATTESFATYGVIDGAPRTEQLRVPADVFPEVGGVEIEVASSQLQSLTDAFGYLYAYPYECAEQRSARMLATSAMGDVLEAFATPGRPPLADLQATAGHDLKILTHDQLRDGGWGYWPESPSDAYVTQQVLRAVVADGGAAGTRDRAVAYVGKDAASRTARIDKRVATAAKDRDPRVDVTADVAMVAADLAALDAAHVDVQARARHLHAAATALGTYPVDAKARLLALVAGHADATEMRARLLADLLSAVHETASAATVTTSFADGERMLLESNAKSTALALDAIMREAPATEVVTKLARGLLDARRRGRWVSTQENLAVLTAMRHYFDTYEKATPAYTGRLWLGGTGYAERAFAGHSLERATARAGWPAFGAGSTQDLTFAKEGTGRMYYRVGITYAPKQVDVPALEAGFLVHRTYTAVDDPSDVTRDAAGHWHVRLGARVVVSLDATVTTPRYDVAFVDPMPAGFEAVNTSLAVAERAATGTTHGEWDHVNMRDERAEAFTRELREGRHVFAYTVRATTPGTFVAAPAKAEEMYAPETFGRSSGEVVVVE